MVTQLQKDAGSGRNALILFDTTGVSTASASETDLLIQSTDTGIDTTGVANGFINLGSFAGGVGFLHLYESSGNAGTIKVYSGLTQSTTGQCQIGTDIALTASGTKTEPISVLPQFLRITMTRTTGNMTVKYRLIAVKTGTM